MNLFRRLRARGLCLAVFLGLHFGALAGWGEESAGWTPSPVTEEDVKPMVENSPFTRPLNLSDSLILTGIASLEEEVVVTLLDKNSKETYVVGGQPNAQGWKMMGLQGGDDLEKITAKISVPGGEVVAVRFDEKQLKPGEGKPAAGQAPGPGDARGPGPGPGGPDGRHGPPPEVREKFGKLSEDQRKRLFEKMGELRAKHPDMSRDEMRQRMGEMLDKEVARAEKHR